MRTPNGAALSSPTTWSMFPAGLRQQAPYFNRSEAERAYIKIYLGVSTVRVRD